MVRGKKIQVPVLLDILQAREFPTSDIQDLTQIRQPSSGETTISGLNVRFSGGSCMITTTSSRMIVSLSVISKLLSTGSGTLKFFIADFCEGTAVFGSPNRKYDPETGGKPNISKRAGPVLYMFSSLIHCRPLRIFAGLIRSILTAFSPAGVASTI